MLTFLIPLKSAQVAVCWERVSALFGRTLASACAQTSPDFRVVVACHEIPAGDFSHAALEFIQARFRPPSAESADLLESDKQRKLLLALHRARELASSHVMFLDSDDLVSNRLAEFVATHSADPGWYLASGYFYCERQPYLHLERRRFNQWCGSSHIVRPALLDFLPRWDDRLVVDHRQLAQMLAERGTPLRPLPFRGGVYTVAHGDNFNDYESLLWTVHPLWRPLRRVLFHRALTPQIRREFGLHGAD